MHNSLASWKERDRERERERESEREKVGGGEERDTIIKTVEGESI